MTPLHIDDPPYIPCPCCRAQSTRFYISKSVKRTAFALCDTHGDIFSHAPKISITKAEYLALQLEAKLSPAQEAV
jgi:hypothetical protein